MYRMSRRAQHLRRCMMDGFLLRSAKDMIFFNSGQPAVELFPAELLKNIFDELLTNEPAVLAYPSSAGDEELRVALAERMNRLHIGKNIAPEQILITNGGTGAADLIAQLFVDPDDIVLTETPTFPETLDCFYKDYAQLVGVPMDIDGPLPDELEKIAAAKNARFFYVIPNFQNPTGRCTSLDRRKAVVEIARKYGFFIIEDDPYHELWFEKPPVDSYYSLAPDCTIYMGSLSKIVAPGVRTGWLVLPHELVDRAETALKATALAYPAIIHRAVSRVLRHPKFNSHVDELRLDLKNRYERLTSLMSAEIPAGALTWETPLGGMFLWCHLPDDVDGMEFALRLRDRYRVAFFPGVCFTPNYEGQEHSLRFSFARPTPDQMAEGVRRIARALKDGN